MKQFIKDLPLVFLVSLAVFGGMRISDDLEKMYNEPVRVDRPDYVEMEVRVRPYPQVVVPEFKPIPPAAE